MTTIFISTLIAFISILFTILCRKIIRSHRIYKCRFMISYNPIDDNNNTVVVYKIGGEEGNDGLIVKLVLLNGNVYDVNIMNISTPSFMEINSTLEGNVVNCGDIIEFFYINNVPLSLNISYRDINNNYYRQKVKIEPFSNNNIMCGDVWYSKIYKPRLQFNKTLRRKYF